MLTVDLGNSRLKASRWRHSGSAFERSDGWEGEDDSLDGFERWLARARPQLAGLTSVAAPERTERVRALLAARSERLLVAPASGLENHCREPERVGADRLYAAAGAAALFRRSCVVVDAGTALTVDALRVEGTTQAFLGGSIAPGPALAAAALASGTARLPLVEPRPGARALGTVTEEALQAGLVVGFRGAAERLVEEVAAEAGLGAAPVVLTGGAREFLLVPRPFTARRLELVPELVQRGLLAALLRAAHVPEGA
jgi:type III pantothenate kinase